MATWMQANNRAPSWSLYPHQSLNSCFETSADIHLEHRHVHNWCSTVSVGFFWMFYISGLTRTWNFAAYWNCPLSGDSLANGHARGLLRSWGRPAPFSSPGASTAWSSRLWKWNPRFFWGFLWFSSMCIVKEHACMHISTYTCQTCHICNKQLSACYISVCVVKWYSILYYIYIYMYTCACRL
jgi:hypothetical protein